MRNLNVTVNLYYKDYNPYYDDTIKHIDGNYYLYTAWGEYNDVEADDLLAIDIENTPIEAIREYVDDNDLTDDEAIDEAQDALRNDYSRFDRAVDDAEEYGINLILHRDYRVVRTVGYSQGDVAYVIVPKDIKVSDDFIHHLMWDTPIEGEIEVSFEFTAPNGMNVTYRNTFDFQEYTNNAFDVNGLDADAIVEEVKEALRYPLTEADEKELREVLGKIDYRDVKYPRSC